ncbi:hypothetical protein [Demequina globuliformis]|uniref:hypothetical protein n=1 Tax=Demequina globuliformis TaxID=676202 RepID=UPI0007848EF3|nr:hypothetical protein [Demequina globuliformis]
MTQSPGGGTPIANYANAPRSTHRVHARASVSSPSPLRRRPRRLLGLSTAAAATMLCAACGVFAPHDVGDIEQQADAVFDMAEATFPGMAEDLDAVLTGAGSGENPGGGLEGGNVFIKVQVKASLDGPQPSTEQIASALSDAGFVDIEVRENDVALAGGRGTTADGTMEAYIGYLFPPEFSAPDYHMVLRSTETLTVPYGDYWDDYRYRDYREFDPSLLTPEQ